jgi:ribosome-associated toxin RatA of RatAB toxin-antitoxin module
MKELRGTATALVPAPMAQCLALVRAVDQYPDWYPDVVRTVEVLERDTGGLPSRARTELHVSVGPLTKDFDLLMAVTFEPPGTVKLVKVGGAAKFDVIWRLSEADGASTRLSLELDANLDAPRFLPLGGVGDSVAQGFISAARAELARRSSSQVD